MTETKICPKCGTQMLPASYGMRMPTPEDEGTYYDMGCFMDEIRAEFVCPACKFTIYENGETDNPNEFGK